MVYTKENIKYLLLSWDTDTDQHIKSFTQPDSLIMSGLFHWHIAFKGDIGFPRTPDEFSKYNLIHLNITPHNLGLIAKLKKIIPRETKILLNVDHAIDRWNECYTYPALFLQEIDRADFIFAVEPVMAQTLSMLLKRNVPCIPHPSPIEQLKPLRKRNGRDKRILVSIHRHDTNWLPPSLVVNGAALDAGWITRAIGCDAVRKYALQNYDEVLPPMPFNELMEYAAPAYCCLESYTLRSYGRFTIECAALGVPVIGSSLVAAQRRCFPQLTTEHMDLRKQTYLLKMLINEPEFHAECGKLALKECDDYSAQNCAALMLDFLNSSQ